MKKIYLLGFLVMAFGCQRAAVTPENQTSESQKNTPLAVTTLTETFETGSKGAYATGDAVLSTGTWTFNDALIGNLAGDAKTGSQSARLRNSGKLSMKFDKTGGAGTVTIDHAAYGSDASGTWQLWYSTNAGVTYTQSGSTVTSAGNTLAKASFTINVSGSVRIEIRKTDGGTNRLNIDNVVINDYSASNPVPSLSGMSPNSATAGASTLTITLTGSNFISSSVALWNGNPLTTTFVSTTQLTASVPAGFLSAAGTALVTVSSPAPGGGTSPAQTFTINAVASGQKKFLFDASQAETAGNADWVIDEDNSTPQRIPTPAQSGITSGTAETYWTGGISSWGIALVKKGHQVETLPSSGLITYGNSSNSQDLSNYHVFVIDEPNKAFTAAEKTAMLQFVQNGGGLVMISDHNVSDRDNDGWDSPKIWNDFFTNNGVVSNPFGMAVDLNNLSGTTSNISTSTSPILNGLGGSVSSIQFNNGASITLNTAKNATVKGHVWRSGYAQTSTNAFCASASYGSGRVFLLGDSSPTDDGTGAPGNTLYFGWTTLSHAPLLLNASLWAAQVQ